MVSQREMSIPKTQDQLYLRISELRSDPAETWLWEQTLHDLTSVGMELCRGGFKSQCPGCKGYDGHGPPRRDLYDALVALCAEEFVVPCECPRQVDTVAFVEFIFKARGLVNMWYGAHRSAVVAFLARDGVVTVETERGYGLIANILPPASVVMQRKQHALGVDRMCSYMARKHDG